MEVLHDRCAGLDVHKDLVMACARVRLAATVRLAQAEFATTTRGLLALADWLADQRCTHVAMEATGVHWKPVWHVLEGRCQLLLVNPAHARNVPGRKSDVTDAQWLADLLAHGLIRPSFVPPAPIQELRDLTRTRKQLVRQVARPGRLSNPLAAPRGTHPRSARAWRGPRRRARATRCASRGDARPSGAAPRR